MQLSVARRRSTCQASEHAARMHVRAVRQQEHACNARQHPSANMMQAIHPWRRSLAGCPSLARSWPVLANHVESRKTEAIVVRSTSWPTRPRPPAAPPCRQRRRKWSSPRLDTASTHVMCSDGALRLGLAQSHCGGTPEAARQTKLTHTMVARRGRRGTGRARARSA